jgi:hypothetical protein
VTLRVALDLAGQSDRALVDPDADMQAVDAGLPGQFLLDRGLEFGISDVLVCVMSTA